MKRELAHHERAVSAARRQWSGTLKQRQIEPEFLERMFSTKDV